MNLRPPARRRIPELDGIRGAAILTVLICHFSIVSSPSVILSEILGFPIGVAVFFALSGFLITDILLARVGEKNYFERFYVRRFFRIFPAYYFFLLCFFHLGPLVARLPGLHSLARGRGEEWWYWSYLYNWSPIAARNRSLLHLWSLCVEEQFYLFWPLVVRYTPRRVLKWVCLGMVLISPLIRLAGARLGVSPMQIYGETIFRLDGLALGALLAIATRDTGLERRIAICLKPLLAAAVLVIITIIWRDGSYFQGRDMLVWGGSALAALSTGAVFYCRQIGRPLRSRFLHSFGKCSYGMYIWHYPLAERVRIELLKFNGHIGLFARWELFGALVIGGIVVSWVIAWLSWQLIEAPALRLRDRVLARQKIEKALMRAASAA